MFLKEVFAQGLEGWASPVLPCPHSETLLGLPGQKEDVEKAAGL